jgi:RNA polymerase sigma-70 factor (ECF subfamily)
LASAEALIPRVYAYVAYRIGHGPDAEDVTSETFERAVRYRDSYAPAKGAPITWLVGIARRCLADRSLPTAASDEPEDVPAADFADELIPTLHLRQAVLTLNKRERELVALRFGADLTARQIGEIVGMKTNAVEVALHRALRTLRAALEGSDDDPSFVGADEADHPFGG